MEMDADALKNEVQKKVVGRWCGSIYFRMMIESRSCRGALERFQHDGKWKQEQLCGEGTVILSIRSMVDTRHINNRSVKRRISRSRGVLRGRS